MVSKEIMNQVGRVLRQNGPAILTGMAVVGVVTTTVLAVGATPEATRLISDAEMRKSEDNAEEGAMEIRYLELTYLETVKVAWQPYIPALAVGAVTIACIIGANSANSRKNAAILSLYTLTDKAFNDYKEQTVKQVGPKKEQVIRDEVAQKSIEENPPQSSIIFTGTGEVLCYETMSGRYFKSDMETIRKAENDINSQILSDMYASQNEFNTLIGLPSTGYGEEVGWNVDNKLEIQFSSVLAENGTPCLAIGYLHTPIRDYHKLS